MAIEKKYVETPLMKQYYAVKAVHPDAILLFRVGDFYETFGDDAIDGKGYTGTYMMAAICNGGYYGGGYQAAPYAAMDDGLLDIVLVKPISRIQVAGILAKYKAGRHMQDADTIVPEFRSFMTFYRARSVEMQVLDNRPIIATIDGECAPVMELKAEVLPSALNVLLPRPACGSAVIRGLYECPMQAKAK